jgi:SAM-dependent methyltransferase
MYDEFSSDYDRFVNWEARLSAEMPFIESQLQAIGAKRVLDAACGTGMHSLAIASRGYRVVGADFSDSMVTVARANAQRIGGEASFEVAAFGELEERVGGGFDALLCLGNSVPHLLEPEQLARALADFRACLRPGGLVLIQNRNFDAVLVRRDRWMDPQAHSEDGGEWLFVRFYDFDEDANITFHVVTLRRDGSGQWSQRIASTRLWPIRQSEMASALDQAGFREVVWWGDMQGAVFDAEHSPNLIVTARRE